MNRALRRQQAKQRRKGGVRRGPEQQLQRALETLQAGDAAAAFAAAKRILQRDRDGAVVDQAAELAAHAALNLASADDSIAAFQDLATLRPDDPGILNDYGGVLSMAGRFDAAEEVYRRGLAARPDDSQAITNVGQALMGQKRFEAAEALFRAATAAPTPVAAAHYGLGNALEALERPLDALEPYREAHRMAPGRRGYRQSYLEALKTCGVGIDERERMYRADLINDPNDFDAAMQLACVMRDTERRPEGRQIIEKWLARENDLGMESRGQLREILSELQFLDNDFAAAWPNYHWRLSRRTRWGGEPVQPAWQGEPLADKSILVYAEQGVGDQVMFMALMADLQRTGVARIVLECDARLVPLFQRSFPDVQCVPVEKPPVAATLDPEIDYHVAMGSLACWLWDAYASRPAAAYLAADPDRTAALRAAYRADGHDVVVGVSWESPRGQHGPVKSMTLQDMDALFAMPGVRFVDLQYGETSAARADFESATGIRLLHDDDVDQMADLDAFAAQIRAMDAVLTVSNSAAHMAGALGVPTYVLLPAAPQWKWAGEGPESVWYSHVRLSRRRRDESAAAQVAEVVESLAERLA